MDWEDEPEPTPFELITLDFAARYERATLALGIRERSRLLLRYLLVGGGFWTVSALAEASGISRSTVRTTLGRLVAQGMVTVKRDLYSITDLGRGLLMRVHRETLEICFGRRDGFSYELISYFRDLPSAKPTGDASRIKFDRP